jgi:hypothetical protein
MKDTIIITPPNQIARIDKVWAILSMDERGEGVCAANIGNDGTMMALITADEGLRI